MGKNNKLRRKQKEKARKKSSSSSPSGSITTEQRRIMHNILPVISETFEEFISQKMMPPKSLIKEMSDDFRFGCPPLLDVLHFYLEFLGFIIENKEPLIQLEKLQPLKPYFTHSNVDMDSDYYLFEALGILSSNNFYQDVDHSVEKLIKEKNDFDHWSELVSLLEFYLIIKGTKSSNANELKDGLELFFDHETSLYRSISSNLLKFLKLKAPKPSLKSVASFELALAKEINKLTETPLLAGVATIVKLKLSNKNTQPNPEDWKQLPHIYQLLTTDYSKENAFAFQKREFFRNKISDQIIETVEYDKLNFQELIKTRFILLRSFLSTQNTASDFKAFTGELQNTILMLSSGIPRGQEEFACMCLEELMHWLCDTFVSIGNHFKSPISGLHKALKKIPKHYITHCLVQVFDPIKAIEIPTSFEAMSFKAFYYALFRSKNQQQFINQYFSPLPKETKKSFLLDFYRRIFFSSAEEDAAIYTWKALHRLILTKNSDWFQDLKNGVSIENELLLYLSMSLTAHQQKLLWLNSEQVHQLGLAMSQLLHKSRKALTLEEAVTLLEALSFECPQYVFSHWQTYQPLLRNIKGKKGVRRVYDRLHASLLVDDAGDHLGLEELQAAIKFLKPGVKKKTTKKKKTSSRAKPLQNDDNPFIDY